MTDSSSTRSTCRPLTTAIVQDLLQSIDYVLLDVDGVLWAGDSVFEGVAETIEWLEKECGLRVRYMTNNATLSRAAAAQKFRSRGLRSATADNIYSSAFIGALHLVSSIDAEDGSSTSEGCSSTAAVTVAKDGSRRYNRDVFVVGTEGLRGEVQEVLAEGRYAYGPELNGIAFDGAQVSLSFDQRVLPRPQLPISISNSGTAPFLPDAHVALSDFHFGAVIAGLDFGWNMTKLAVAAMVLQEHIRAPGRSKVKFVATNADPQIPMGKARWLLPGAGALIASLATVAGREPDVVCGKPAPTMLDALFAREGIQDPSRCLMVGDRLTTDIAFGNSRGTKTLFVLSGAESMADVTALEHQSSEYAARHTPMFVAPGLWELHRLGAPARSAAKL